MVGAAFLMVVGVPLWVMGWCIAGGMALIEGKPKTAYFFLFIGTAGLVMFAAGIAQL